MKDMKKYYSLLVFSVGILTLMSCKEKKNTGVIITKKPVVVAQRQIMKTGDYAQSRKVDWLGAVYTVETKRVADPSLPVIADGNTKYYDNRITVRILRSDGSEFFNRTFTKTDFSSYVGKTYADGALVGIVLDRAEGDNLLFAASVGSPDKMSDEYIPLLMKVSRQGGITISKDTQLDIGSDDTSEVDLAEEEGM